MSRYYNAKVTLLDEDYEKLLEFSSKPENDGLKGMLSLADVGHYMDQTVLVFNSYNYFEPYLDDNVAKLYKFLGKTGCAKVVTMDEEGLTGYREFQGDDEKKERFDSGIVWYDSVYQGVKFSSLEDAILKGIEDEFSKLCNRDEIKDLDEKKLDALLRKVNKKIKELAPQQKKKNSPAR